MGTQGYIETPPRCTTCGFIIERNGLFLFNDGSPACSNCTYRCSVCKVSIQSLTIVVGTRAFCETCFEFECRDCKGKIRYKYSGHTSRRSDGFFWLKCSRSFDSFWWQKCAEPVKANIAAAVGQESRPASSQTQRQSVSRDDLPPGLVESLVERCSVCNNKIEDQAYCATCFKCRSCKKQIENLKYARTSKGILCIECHESVMQRRRKRSQKNGSNRHKLLSPRMILLDKCLPSLPPEAVNQSAVLPDNQSPPSESYSETPTELRPAAL